MQLAATREYIAGEGRPPDGEVFLDEIGEDRVASGWRDERGVATGPWLVAHVDGNWWMFNYVGGVTAGWFANMRADGSVECLGEYRDGRCEGEWFYFDEASNLVGSKTYAGGVATGDFQLFHGNCVASAIGRREPDTSVGRVREYDEYGHLVGAGPIQFDPRDYWSREVGWQSFDGTGDAARRMARSWSTDAGQGVANL